MSSLWLHIYLPVRRDVKKGRSKKFYTTLTTNFLVYFFISSLPLFLFCVLLFVIPCVCNVSKPSGSTPICYLTNSVRPKGLFPFGTVTASPDLVCVAYGFHSSIAASKCCVFNNFTVNQILKAGSPNYICILRLNKNKEESNKKSETSCSEKL